MTSSSLSSGRGGSTPSRRADLDGLDTGVVAEASHGRRAGREPVLAQAGLTLGRRPGEEDPGHARALPERRLRRQPVLVERLHAELAQVAERRAESGRRDHLVHVEDHRAGVRRSLGVHPPAVGGLLDVVDRAVDDEAAAAEQMVLEDLDITRPGRRRHTGDDRRAHMVGRAEDQLRGPREQRVGDLERRVALADDEDLLALEGLRGTVLQIVVVGHELDTGRRRPPRVATCQPRRRRSGSGTRRRSSPARSRRPPGRSTPSDSRNGRRCPRARRTSRARRASPRGAGSSARRP